MYVPISLSTSWEFLGHNSFSPFFPFSFYPPFPSIPFYFLKFLHIPTCSSRPITTQETKEKEPTCIGSCCSVGSVCTGPYAQFPYLTSPSPGSMVMSITCTGETQICLTIYTRHTATNRSTGSRLSTEWLQKPNCHPCSWVVRFRWRPLGKTSSLQSIAQDGY